MRIYVPSSTYDVISFNGQGQLCQLTCAGWRDLSKHARMSTIRVRRLENKTKKNVTFNRQFSWKSCSTTHLPFRSSNLNILKAFPKTFPNEMKPTKCSAKEKMRQEKRKEKASLEILLSAHIRSVFCIWISNLDQKAAKCTTCKRFCGNFPLFIARQWPENGSTSFKTWFSTKFPGVKGLIDWDRDFCSHVASHTYLL